MNYTAIALTNRSTARCWVEVLRPPMTKTPRSRVEDLEGDAIADVLLPCLCSVDGNGDDGPVSGAFDVLPDG